MAKKPKVLFVSLDAGRTGAPIMLLHLLRWLKANTSLDFEILLRWGGPLELEFCKLAPTYLAEPWDKRRWIAGLGKRFRRGKTRAQITTLRRLSGRTDLGLIYANTIVNGEALAALKRTGCPSICHVHELGYWIERGGRENLDMTMRCTTHFVAAAQAVKDNLVQNHGVAEDRITVVHECIPLENPASKSFSVSEMRARMGISNNAFVLGGAGAEFWRKGRDLIPQLLLALKQHNLAREIHFVWVGNKGTPLQNYELRHDLDRAGVSVHYHESGEVANPMDYFAAIDAFVLLSREDPYPLVCLEAALLGKPLLCFSGSGGAPELIENDAGFVVPYLDIRALAEKVCALSESADLCKRLGETARGKVRARHSVEVTGPRLLELINAHLCPRNFGGRSAPPVRV